MNEPPRDRYSVVCVINRGFASMVTIFAALMQHAKKGEGTKRKKKKKNNPFNDALLCMRFSSDEPLERATNEHAHDFRFLSAKLTPQLESLPTHLWGQFRTTLSRPVLERNREEIPSNCVSALFKFLFFSFSFSSFRWN